MSKKRRSARSAPLVAGAKGVSFPEDTYLSDASRDLIYLPVPKVACSSLKVWFMMTSPDLGFQPDPETWNPNAYLRGEGSRYLLEDPDLLRAGRTFRFAFVRNPWSRLVSAYVNRIVSRAFEYRKLMKKLARGRWYRLDRRVQYYARKYTQGVGWNESAEVTFREFVMREVARAPPMEMDPHWRPQYVFLGGHDVDFLGRFERLAEDLEELTRKIGGTADVPKRNWSQYAGYDDGACVADCPQARLRAMPAMPQYRQFYTPELVDVVARVYEEDIVRFGYDF